MAESAAPQPPERLPERTSLLNMAWVKLNQLSQGLIAPPPPTPIKKHVLVVHAHPLPESFSRALAETARRALLDAGHRVTFLSLYDQNFRPALTADERRRYMGPTDSDPGLPAYPTASADVADSVKLLSTCDALVVVYPTWWFNVPGILKGWVDRAFLPGTAFKLPHLEPDDSPKIPGSAIIPGLPNVRQFGILTTFGATRVITAACGDNGRNMWCRALLPMFHPFCSVNWLGLYDMDHTTPAKRAAFLESVRQAYLKF